MSSSNEKHLFKLGVTVGRFQVPRLHFAHRRLIGEALSHNDAVLVLLGSPVGKADARNALDFQTRKVMILDEFYNDVRLSCRPVYDVANQDDVWSKEVDRCIHEYLSGYLGFGEHEANRAYRVQMIGGRDSFLKHYVGKYKDCRLDMAEIRDFSGTKDRDAVTVLNSSDFRAGVIYAYQNLEVPHAKR